MFRKIFFIIFTLILTINSALAHIDIVYPSNKELTINSKETYISGNTNKDAVLEINSEKVKLWGDGFFVHMVDLDYGMNKVKIEAKTGDLIEKEVLKIKRPRPIFSKNKSTPTKSIEYIKNEEGVLYTKIIKDRATIRSKASSNSSRVVDLPKGIVLYLDGKKGDYYKVQETGEQELWIHKTNIEEPVQLSKRIEPKIKKIKHSSDDLYDYQKIYLNYPVIFTHKQENNKIILTLYGIKDKDEPSKNNFEYTFKFDKPILGYEFYYDDNKLVFKKASFPIDIDDNRPLENINIFVDAGHGGYEKGTVGPSRVFEKDVNLDITKKLISLLNEAGANVTFSRTTDKQVNLYDRVDLAKENNALISLSIHANSLPYGKNPYEQHGTEVHYYNQNAKMLAEIIKYNLANDMNLKDNGIHRTSLALNRSTNPVSVLVEVAYMLNPEEYTLLQDEKFRYNVAKSIKKSLEEYILCLKNKKL